MKKHLAAMMAVCSVMPHVAEAQEQKAIMSTPKLSGCVIGQYQYVDKDDAENNSFNVRNVRVAIDGRILDDFAYKVQAQITGTPTTMNDAPRIVDAFVEWQKHKEIKVKFGQFKRPFTFENPMHPIDQGFINYAQGVLQLAGFTDRVGEHSSNGRDIGLQLQGDVLKMNNGRHLLHYQIGVFNGQGINTKDVDNQKDVIGGFWLMPIEGLRLGAFGWTGTYARKGSNGVKSLSRDRYAISGEYAAHDWTIRSEYIHSTGYAFANVYNEKADLSKDEVNTAKGNKADGFYVLVIAPVKKKKLHVKARYDLYRPTADWQQSKSTYEVGVDYVFSRNLQVNLGGAWVNDRTLSKHDYCMLDTQISFRF